MVHSISPHPCTPAKWCCLMHREGCRQTCCHGTFHPSWGGTLPTGVSCWVPCLCGDTRLWRSEAMNCCVLPKRQRVSESEPAAHIHAKRYKVLLHVSCSAELINFNRYCEVKLYADFKAKHLRRQEQGFFLHVTNAQVVGTVHEHCAHLVTLRTLCREGWACQGSLQLCRSSRWSGVHCRWEQVNKPKTRGFGYMQFIFWINIRIFIEIKIIFGFIIVAPSI